MNEEPEQQEVHISVLGQQTGINAEFADGVFAIPDWVVTELGGPEEVSKLSEAFKTTTLAATIDALHAITAERYVNKLQADIISRHFGNGIPGPFTPQ